MNKPKLVLFKYLNFIGMWHFLNHLLVHLHCLWSFYLPASSHTSAKLSSPFPLSDIAPLLSYFQPLCVPFLAFHGGHLFSFHTLNVLGKKEIKVSEKTNLHICCFLCLQSVLIQFCFHWNRILVLINSINS